MDHKYLLQWHTESQMSRNQNVGMKSLMICLMNIHDVQQIVHYTTIGVNLNPIKHVRMYKSAVTIVTIISDI